MFLRVADVLIDMLIGALRTLDRINQSLRIRSLDGLTHLAAYEAALKMIISQLDPEIHGEFGAQ